MDPKTARQTRDHEATGCKHCEGALESVGKLPAIGLKPLIKVFRCCGCNRISWNET
jgi:hypothetical protein